MLRLILSAVSLASTIFASFAASSADAPFWKSVGLWEIRVDNTLGYGCFLLAGYKGGSVLRIGFDRNRGNAYVMISRESWTSLEPGKEYALEMQFDGKPRWQARATAIRLGGRGIPMLYVPFTDSDFIGEFMRSHGLRIWYRGEQISNLSLRGSYEAAQEMVNCQAQIETVRQGQKSDPFAAGSRGSTRNDPFAH